VPNKNANTMSMFIINLILFRILVSYEYTHNPDLFNHTRVGRIE